LGGQKDRRSLAISPGETSSIVGRRASHGWMVLDGTVPSLVEYGTV
jgi:hypothetical protein